MRVWTARRLGISAFGLGCLILILIGWISARRMVELREANESVDRALMLRQETEVFLSLVKDAETRRRLR